MIAPKPAATQPAFMGNNQSLLAQQLAAGGYGDFHQLMASLAQTHTPMQFTPPTDSTGTGTGTGTGTIQNGPVPIGRDWNSFFQTMTDRAINNTRVRGGHR